MKIKYRVKVGDFKVTDEIKNAVLSVLDSGMITEGQKTKEFERAFSEYIGTRYCVALNSGTSALIAGLTALKLCNGGHIESHVITTPLSYIATSNAIVMSGYYPVFVDIDPETFLIDPEKIAERLEKDENGLHSVVLPVHLMGYPCDMEKINRIAHMYDLYVFEDSAQAHGTLYKGSKTGSLADLSAFSFYIAHNIQAGELGAVTTNIPEIKQYIKKIKAHGRMCNCDICTRSQGICPGISRYENEIDDCDPRFTSEYIGYNFKTMDLQVAIALTQLEKADWIVNRRSLNVKLLNTGLEKHSDVLQLPVHSINVSYLAYPVVIRKPEKISRKKLRSELEKRGIETRPLFGCIPTQQPAYSMWKRDYEGKLPNAEYAGKHGFYIGCHQYLSQDDIDYIIKTFDEVLAS